jgi:hypothetical protein
MDPDASDPGGPKT